MKFLLVFHFLVTLALVGIILLQKSGDTALGIGGSTGGLLNPRGQANLLTRATGWLAAIFIFNSILMAAISKPTHKQVSVVDQAVQDQIIEAPVQKTTEHKPLSSDHVDAPTVPQKKP